MKDLKIEDIKSVENEHPIPSHILKAQKEKQMELEREKEREKEREREHEREKENQVDPNFDSLKPPALAPISNNHPQQSNSPALKPVMHFRRSPSNSPMIQPGRQLGADVNKQLASPLTRLRQLGQPNKLDPIQNLPPVYSPQLAGSIRPLMDHKDRAHILSAQNFLNPQNDFEMKYMKESPQLGFSKPKSRNSENKDPNSYSPSIQLPSLNGSRRISQSPNLAPLVARSKQMEHGMLPSLNGKGSQTPGAKVGLKREALKGFDKAVPTGEYIAPRNIQLEFSPRPLINKEPLSGFKEKNGNRLSDSDDELEEIQAAVAKKGEKSRQASDAKSKKEQDDNLVVVGHRLRFNSGAEEEIFAQGKDLKSGDSTPSIRLMAPLIYKETVRLSI